MSRIQKKCVILSVGFHLLLVVILAVGPAFLASSSKVDNQPLIDFIPLKTIDDAMSGGGNPNARPPAPTPPQPQPPQPQPQPQTSAPAPEPPTLERQPKPEPQRRPDPVKPETPERDPTAPKTAKKLPDVSLTPIKRSNSNKKPSPTANTSRTSQSNTDERATQIARAAANAARSIRAGVSDGAVDMPELQGPSGGGVPYGNFLAAIKKVYTDAWIVSDGITDDKATAVASVTIARDGTVKEARLIRSSGNSLLDQSVEMVLRRVRFAVRLPDGAKENERTVTINFNVKAKQGLG
jgi:TonB family protein